MSSKHSKAESDSVFKGTKYEQLENKLKNEINKKRHRDDNDETVSKKPKTTTNSKTNGDTSGNSSKPKESKQITNSAKATSSKIISSSSTAPESSYNNNRTVYVQGLPFTCTEVEVTNFFKSCGEVNSIRLPKWHDSGNLKGYGHIEFKTADSATKALELSGQYLKDRYVMVERPMTPRVLETSQSATTESTSKVRPPGCRTVFVKNLPYEITEQELRQAFMVYGPILIVRLACWGHTNNKKGFGYIEFKREDSCEIAVKKSGTLLIKDRPAIVDYETGKAKGGFKSDKNAGKLQPRVIKRK